MSDFMTTWKFFLDGKPIASTQAHSWCRELNSGNGRYVLERSIERVTQNRFAGNTCLLKIGCSALIEQYILKNAKRLTLRIDVPCTYNAALAEIIRQRYAVTLNPSMYAYNTDFDESLHLEGVVIEGGPLAWNAFWWFVYLSRVYAITGAGTIEERIREYIHNDSGDAYDDRRMLKCWPVKDDIAMFIRNCGPIAAAASIGTPYYFTDCAEKNNITCVQEYIDNKWEIQL